MMECAREEAQIEDRSVAQILLRWMRKGWAAEGFGQALQEAQSMGTGSVRGEGGFSDAGSGTEKGVAEKKSRSVPVAARGAEDGGPNSVTVSRTEAPSGADKAPGAAQTIEAPKNSEAPARPDLGGPPRIRIGSGLHGGESFSFDHRPAVTFTPPEKWPWDGFGEKPHPEAQTIPKNSGEVLTPEPIRLKARSIGISTAALPDGVACPHPGCLSHFSHPCEGCGRIGGRYQVLPPFGENLIESVNEEGWSKSRDLKLELDAKGKPFNPYDCAGCRAAMKHAYSDATTPGFFYDRCEKHRTAPVETPDIRNAVGVVTVEEMPIEEAKRRFPGLSGTPINLEPFRPAPGGCAITYEPGKEPTDEQGTKVSHQKDGADQASNQARGIQPRNSRSGKSSSRLLGLGNRTSRTGRSNKKSNPAPAQAKAGKPKHTNLRDKTPSTNSIEGGVQAPGKLRSAVDLAQKIPGVAVAAEVPPPDKKRCRLCGGKMKTFTGTKLRCENCGGIEMK